MRFKGKLKRNITIKLGYANAKIYQCRPGAGGQGSFLARQPGGTR